MEDFFDRVVSHKINVKCTRAKYRRGRGKELPVSASASQTSRKLSTLSTSSRFRKPSINTPFKQQTLKSWHPILNIGSLLPKLFLVVIFFTPVGIGIFFFSSNGYEKSFDYTDCISSTSTSNTTTTSATKTKCSDLINKDNFHVTCTCEPIEFLIDKPIRGQLYIYYALTNFYQNHHRYKDSMDNKQLLGLTGPLDNPTKPQEACHPFDYDGSKIILPCGAIANTMFSDEITLFKGNDEIPLSHDKIAAESDLKFKYKNPPWFSEAQKNVKHIAWTIYTKPKAWKKNLWELPNGVENKDLAAWMKIAAFPNFRKLHRLVDHETADLRLGIRNGLPVGRYSLKVEYSFPATPYKGRKSIVITSNSFIGGYNYYIGPTYLAICGVYIVIVVVFMCLYWMYNPHVSEDI